MALIMINKSLTNYKKSHEKSLAYPNLATQSLFLFVAYS